MILLEKRFRNYAHLIVFADAAVPYLLTISDTERLGQSAPFISVKKCLKSHFQSLRKAMIRISRYVSRALHICHSMALRLNPTKVRI